MPQVKEITARLSGNQLKILAMAAMTCDHVGLVLLPQYPVLRVLGRLALPIYAYMIAEGCRYTHDRKGYLKRIAVLAVLCQAAYFLAVGSLYQCILVSFCLSVCLIYALDRFRQRPSILTALTLAGMVLGIWFLSRVLPRLLRGTDFALDYGFWGVMLPVLVYAGRDRGEKLLLLALGLGMLGLTCGGNQWWAFAALIPLALYSGRRGRTRIGKLFYIYYPAHLVVIYGIRLLLLDLM